MMTKAAFNSLYSTELQKRDFSLPLSAVADQTDTKRKTVTLNLNPETREIIEKIKDDTGVAQVVALQRILEWFSGLDRKLRLAILNRDEETRRELIQLVLQEILAG